MPVPAVALRPIRSIRDRLRQFDYELIERHVIHVARWFGCAAGEKKQDEEGAGHGWRSADLRAARAIS